MSKNTVVYFSVVLFSLLILSCGHSHDHIPDMYKGYEKLDNHIHYKFLKKVEKRNLPQEGDVCVFHSTIKRLDETLSSTYYLGNMAERIINTNEDGFPVQRILPMMSVGDSVSVLILVDSLAEIPPQFYPSEWMNVIIKLEQINTLADRQAQKQTELEDLKLHPKGFYWKQHKSTGGKTAQPSDEVTFNFTLRKSDKIQFETPSGQKERITIPVTAQYMTPLHTALMAMSAGDSATIAFDVDKLQEDIKSAFELQGFFSGELMTMDIQVFNIKDTIQVKRELEALKSKGETLAKKLKTTIQDIKADKVKLESSETGLKYIVHEMGKGQVKHDGESVAIHYIGYLYDAGTKFDASFDRGVTLDFTVGAREMILGVDEAVATLPVGTRVTLILPQQLGYGEEGNPPAIPPNATLAFYIEIVE